MDKLADWQSFVSRRLVGGGCGQSFLFLARGGAQLGSSSATALSRGQLGPLISHISDGIPTELTVQ